MRFDQLPLKRLFKVVGGSTPASDNPVFWSGPVTWVTPVDLGEARYVSKSARTLSDAGYAACGTVKVPAGSLVLSTRAPIGSIAIAAKELCTNQGCKSLIPRAGVDSRYFYYQLSVRAAELNSLGRGSTFLELPASVLEEVSLFAPDADTQTAIANYLDAKTAAIDALIAKKEQLVEDLRTYQDSVIFETVSAASYGAQRFAKIGRLYSLSMGETILSDNLTSEGYPVYSATRENVYFGKIQGPKVVLRPGDIVVGARGTIGFPKLVSVPAAATQTTIVMRDPKQIIDSRFMLYWLKANKEECFWYDQTAVPQLTISRLGAFKVGIPTRQKQHEVANALDNLVARVGMLTEKVSAQLLELRNYRTALISEAVTGKLTIPT